MTMSPKVIQDELLTIRIIRKTDPSEADERLEELKIKVSEYINNKGIDGVWRETLERTVDL